MVALSQDQRQSYMNLINQANLGQGRHQTAKSLLNHPSKSLDEINERLSFYTRIDVAIFKAILNPAPVVPVQEPVQEIAPAPTPEVAVEAAQQEPVQEIAPAPTPEVAVAAAQQEPVSSPELVPEPVVAPEVAQETVIESQQAPVILEAVEKTPPTLNKYQLKAQKKLVENKSVPAEKPVEEAAPKPQADNKTYKVVSCSENEAGKVVANATPIIISEDSPKSFLKAIEECSSLVNNDKLSYISTNGACELPSSNGEAKAMCYLEILPSDITVPSSDHTTPIYSCSYNSNSYQKGGVPFAYISKTDLGRVDQVHDCADWALKGGESLAIGNRVCSAFYPDVDSALAGCLSNLSHLI